MKLYASLSCLLMGMSSLFAGEPFVTPEFVKEFEQLDEAKQEAADSGKVITFLLMEPGST